MFMATAASLYSSSPPTIPSASSSTSQLTACSSSPIDIELHTRAHVHHHHHSPGAVIGGLSSLFSGNSNRFSACAASDVLSIDGSSLSRRSSYTDLNALPESCERPESTASSKLKETSPVSSLQGPSSVGSSQICSNRSFISDNKPAQKLNSDDSLSLNSFQSGLRHSFLSEIDLSVLEAMPDMPCLTRVGCISLSEFFCKPLFTEAFCTSKDILRWAQHRHEIFKDPFVIKAFEEAKRAHDGQFRANGDLYLVHCVETALILAAIGASNVVVAAGLLHDTLDDTSLTSTQLLEMFGLEVANLVEGVCVIGFYLADVLPDNVTLCTWFTVGVLIGLMISQVKKLSEFSKLARDNGTAYRSVEADRLHTMMLAMADIRIVLIKLADRLHNMRTLGALPKDKQSRIAKETLEVFVPLAGRLGIWSWKAELEDLCFKGLKPLDHQELHTKLSEGFRDRTIVSAIRTLDEALSSRDVQYMDLCGRPKNLYSIHKKMLLKGRTVNNIYDVQGLRLIVENVEDCYSALEVVHETWQCIPGKLKDYIRHPKMNGYQSLHTVVCGEDGLPLEIQIRTMDMHYRAEFGVAAHWRYKELNSPHSQFVLQMVEWARWVLSWQNEIMDTKLRLSRIEGDVKPVCSFPLHREGCLFTELCQEPPHHEEAPLFVIVLEADHMMVKELPRNSSVADLLERAAKEDELVATLGGFLEEARPKVNHKEVMDTQQKLKMGDLVELQHSVAGELLDEYREKLMRLFHDCSVDGLKIQPQVSHVELAETLVF